MLPYEGEPSGSSAGSTFPYIITAILSKDLQLTGDVP